MGVYERDSDSGVWWVRYSDAAGKIHREKVGPKRLAQQVYAKRKTQIREGKFFADQLNRKRLTVRRLMRTSRRTQAG